MAPRWKSNSINQIIAEATVGIPKSWLHANEGRKRMWEGGGERKRCVFVRVRNKVSHPEAYWREGRGAAKQRPICSSLSLQVCLPLSLEPVFLHFHLPITSAVWKEAGVSLTLWSWPQHVDCRGLVYSTFINIGCLVLQELGPETSNSTRIWLCFHNSN